MRVGAGTYSPDIKFVAHHFVFAVQVLSPLRCHSKVALGAQPKNCGTLRLERLVNSITKYYNLRFKADRTGGFV